MMKFGATLIVFSTIVAVIYGVLFSTVYTEVPIDGGIVALCAILGIATCLMVVAVWKFVVKQ